MKLEMQLLGVFEVYLDGQQVEKFRSAKVRALMAYLAAEAGKPQSRSSLACLLWPDWPEDAANKNLRHTLYWLRRVLNENQSPASFVRADRGTITLALDQGVEIDTLALSRSLAEAVSNPTDCRYMEKLERVTAQVRGLFLEGFLLDDSPVFECWLLNRREHHNRQLLEAHDLLCAWHEANGAYHQAEHHAWRQLELEPWRESAYRQLMSLLVKQGKCSQALVQYERLKRELKEGLGASPSRATRLLYERIKDGGFDQRVGLVETPLPTWERPKHNLSLELTSFIGREQETAGVCVMLSKNRLVTLTGVGGTGKTRLALRVASELLDSYQDGIWQVELAALTDPTMVPKAVASTLGLPEVPGKTIFDTLVTYLKKVHTAYSGQLRAPDFSLHQPGRPAAARLPKDGYPGDQP